MMDSLERASGELERLSKEKGQRKEMSQSQRARDTEGEKKEAEGDNEMVVVEVRGFSFSAELHDADNSEVINIEIREKLRLVGIKAELFSDFRIVDKKKGVIELKCTRQAQIALLKSNNDVKVRQAGKSLVLMNVSGLQKKRKTVKLLQVLRRLKHQPSIVVVPETMFDSKSELDCEQACVESKFQFHSNKRSPESYRKAESSPVHDKSSGGIAVLVDDDLGRSETMKDNGLLRDGVVWVRVICKDQSHLYICAVYVPHAGSVFRHELEGIRSAMELGVQRFSGKGLIAFAGDFNARLGRLPSVGADRVYDRSASKDDVLDPRGRDMLDFWSSLQMVVLHATETGPSDANFAGYTNRRANGNSVVDFIVAQEQALHMFGPTRVLESGRRIVGNDYEHEMMGCDLLLNVVEESSIRFKGEKKTACVVDRKSSDISSLAKQTGERLEKWLFDRHKEEVGDGIRERNEGEREREEKNGEEKNGERGGEERGEERRGGESK